MPLLFLSLIRGVSVFISASKPLTCPSGKGQWAEVGICGQGTNVREQRVTENSRGLRGDAVHCGSLGVCREDVGLLWHLAQLQFIIPQHL